MTTTTNKPPTQDPDLLLDLPDFSSQEVYIMQSQSSFVQNVLLHPSEDCWSDELSDSNASRTDFLNQLKSKHVKH